MYLFLTKHGQQYYQRPIMSQTGSRNQLKVAKGAFRGNKTKQSKQNTQTKPNKQDRKSKRTMLFVCLFLNSDSHQRVRRLVSSVTDTSRGLKSCCKSYFNLAFRLNMSVLNMIFHTKQPYLPWLINWCISRWYGQALKGDLQAFIKSQQFTKSLDKGMSL